MRQGLSGYFGSKRPSTAAVVTAWAIAVVLPLLASAGAAAAETFASLPAPSQAIEKIGAARPVAAWSKFCERYPGECAVNTDEPATIPLTSDLWRKLAAVNKRVNGRIKPVTDAQHWGLVDQWDFPEDGYGDCEDYQLLKRKLLVDAGVARRALVMTVVIDEKDEGHAVLMVRTDHGDLILDNKTSAILPWQQTGYVFVKREGQDSLAWVSLGGVTSPTATANR